MNYHSLNEADMKQLRSMMGPERFSTGASNLDLHSRDQSYHRPSRPEVVIWPETRSEVSKILKYADENKIPVTGWGSGTSLEGNPIPVERGIILDFSRMDHVLGIREEDFQADVEPGVLYRDLNERLRHKGLFFPPDPGAQATIGGMIANNASGTRTVRYGSTKDYVLRLTVALAGGEVIEIGTRASKTSSGYDLIHLFVGSEGTLGVILEATVRLIGSPVEFSAAISTFPSVEAAGKAVFDIIRSGLDPAALELLDPECIEVINQEKALGLDVSPTLFMEFHGSTKNQLSEVMDMARDLCTGWECSTFRSGLGRDERDRIFEARYELGEMIIRRHPGCAKLTIDVAVPITAYPEIIASTRRELVGTGLSGYAFGHAGDGNIHFVLIGPEDEDNAMTLIHQVSGRMVSKAISLGGTATGEHGVGIGKREFMLQEHGKSLDWMKKVKDLFDPNGILNPGKIFP